MYYYFLCTSLSCRNVSRSGHWLFDILVLNVWNRNHARLFHMRVAEYTVHIISMLSKEKIADNIVLSVV